MKSKYIILLVLLFLIGCSEDFTPGNPLDPDNPEYISPIVTIISGPEEGDVIQLQTVSFGFEGNQSAMLYRTKIDDSNWSGWVSSNSITYDYLDEGYHLFSLQAKYTTGDTTNVSEIGFEINAIPGPSLRVYRLYNKIYQSQKLNLSIVAEEVNQLVGAEINFQYDNNIIRLDSILIGDFFSANGGQPVLMDPVDIGTGDIRIDVGVLGGDPVYLTGTGEIVELYFTPLLSGITQISLLQNCTFRDENNNEILIEELHDGLVEIQ